MPAAEPPPKAGAPQPKGAALKSKDTDTRRKQRIRNLGFRIRNLKFRIRNRSRFGSAIFLATTASFEGALNIMLVLVLQAGLFRSGWVPCRWAGVSELGRAGPRRKGWIRNLKFRIRNLKFRIRNVTFRIRGGSTPGAAIFCTTAARFEAKLIAGCC